MSGEVSSTATMPENADDRRNWVEFVHFHLDDNSYKIELGRIRQIVRNPRITQVPQTGSVIAGIANLGGEIAVAIDGRSLFRTSARPDDAESTLLLFDRPNAQPSGLLVDDVAGIDPHHVEDIDAPGDADDWAPEVGERWFRAVVDDSDETDHPVGIIDLDAIVAEARDRS